MNMMNLFQALYHHAVQLLCQTEPSLNRNAAQRLLEAHLEPAHFAMPIHNRKSEQALLAWSRGTQDMNAATALLQFEDTHTITGIVRVLARTHINRQGVANVTRGAIWKAQSPRVLELFSPARDARTLRAWFDYTPLINAWLKVAANNSGSQIQADLLFSPADLGALQALAHLKPDEAQEAGASQVGGIHGPGWARVVLGLYTGILYLERCFAFDANNVWKALDNAQSASEVDALTRMAQNQVTEFGPRLSASFFADLGSPNFVKADTHVEAIVMAAKGMASRPTAQQCIDFVRDMARATGRTPRAIDKLMYLACSGKFYLAGIAPVKAQATRSKQSLLGAIRQLAASCSSQAAAADTLSSPLTTASR